MLERFLFDTSTVRGLGLKGLKDLNGMEEVRIFTSPYNFWEILCHLEEHFQCYRSHLLKFRYSNVLDSPKRTTLQALSPKKSKMKFKVPDDVIIQKVVDKLDTSNSLKDFYSKHIKDPQGVREISNCVRRVQEELKRREETFIKKVGGILEGFYSKELHIPGEKDYEALDCLIRDRPEKGETSTHGNKTGEVNNQAYVFTSYMLHLALKYYRNCNPPEDISRNDFEDATITLHLNLDSDETLISGDEEVVKFVDKTRDILTQVKSTPAFGVQKLGTFRDRFEV